MIEAARAYGVPIVRDEPVAHALYELETGAQIPEALYEAVAEVLRAAWESPTGTKRRDGSLDDVTLNICLNGSVPWFLAAFAARSLGDSGAGCAPSLSRASAPRSRKMSAVMSSRLS